MLKLKRAHAAGVLTRKQLTQCIETIFAIDWQSLVRTKIDKNFQFWLALTIMETFVGSVYAQTNVEFATKQTYLVV